jgi:hypothetical protein
MVIAVGAVGEGSGFSTEHTVEKHYKALIPYKFIFSSGVILFLAGIGFVTLSGRNGS